MIREYRTPIMMRTACGVLFHLFAVFLAPYFAHFCGEQRTGTAAQCAARGTRLPCGREAVLLQHDASTHLRAAMCTATMPSSRIAMVQ